MFRMLLTSTVAMVLPATVMAQSVISGTYITPNAVSDQQTLCAGTAAWPAQFTWAPFAPGAREATTADNLVPEVDQYHAGMSLTGAPAVRWSSLASNGATCQEIFRTANSVLYTDAQLQTMANTGCGPFGNVPHIDLFRMWQAGDTFVVRPAVYAGAQNDMVMHALSDYWNGGTVPVYEPNNITIVGDSSSGIKPVLLRDNSGAGDSETAKAALLIEGGQGNTVSNLDVVLAPSGFVLQSLVYLAGAGRQLYSAQGQALTTPAVGGVTTLANMRVTGAEQEEAVSGGANGIFGDAYSNGGTLWLDKVEVDHDGGSGPQWSGGPGHGVYIGPSSIDPSWTVRVTGSYFHDIYYGHELKIRAPRETVIGNYFQGGLPQGGVYTQAEAFDLDVPNGGLLDAEDNVFVKNNSGPNSNNVLMAYGEEGLTAANGAAGGTRPLSLKVVNNTFVAFAPSMVYASDNYYAPLQPFEFFWSPAVQIPGAAGFPVAAQNTMVARNAYVGFCPMGSPIPDYRGSTALLAGFADLNGTYSFGGLWMSADQSIVGQLEVKAPRSTTKRLTAAVGAED